MPNKEYKLFIENVNAHLDKVDFNYNSIPDDGAKTIIEQNIKVIECKKDSITIQMERFLSSKTEDKPIVYVSAIFNYRLSKNTIDNFESLDEMQEYAQLKAGFLVDKVNGGAEISRIIADVTGSFGHTPVVLPPILSLENADSKK